MSNIAVILYDCDGCPCFNVEHEGPCDCNLGYTTRSERIDGNWHHVSSDCQLLEIRTRDKVITPTARNDDLDCHHEFFKCQVPAGDSCVAIYHQICRKCCWDENKDIFMPPNIWRGWAVPQLEKLDKVCKEGKMKSRVWINQDELSDDLDDTDYLISPVIETLGLRGEICDNSAQWMIDHFTPWALSELFFTCVEVAWRCGVARIKRRIGRRRN